jgi:acetyl-CoA carboxylase biotin carboxyl carrier protein
MTLAPDEIKQIVAVLDGSCWGELSVTVGQTTLVVSKAAALLDPPSPSAPAVLPAPTAASPSSEVVGSPSVGIFWRSIEPDGPPLVEVGDAVAAGARLGSVAVMTTVEPVVNRVAGVVASVDAENGQSVEYGRPLFTVASVSG